MDSGATWTQVTSDAEWPERFSPGIVVMPDGRIVLTGGYRGYTSTSFRGRVMEDYHGVVLNDTWQSTDNGTTWMQITNEARWYPRYGQKTLLMPDGSVVLSGAVTCENPSSYHYPGDPIVYRNDVWRWVPGGSITSAVIRQAWKWISP